MQIHLNGVAHQVASGSTLRQVLAALATGADSPGHPMATAVNDRHVARGERESWILAEGDRITTFEPITGG